VDQLTLADQLRSISFIAMVERIAALDDIWTYYVENGRASSPDDIQILDDISVNIITLLSQCPEEVRWASEVMNRNREATNRTLQAFFDGAPLDPQTRQEINSKLLGQPGLVEAVSRAAQEFPGRVDAEKRDIQDKMARIKAGKPTDGDISHDTMCFLQGVGVGLTAGTAVIMSSAAEGLAAYYQAVQIASSCF
jgi:hypothetical protein